MSVIPFSYDDHPVRVIERDGEPWFVAKDVTDVLDLGTEHLRRDLDPDEVAEANLPTGQVGGRLPLIISEAGLYSLILRSRKPEARLFKRWVTHEVIPSIRKTGSYSVAPALTDDQIVAQALAITTKRVEALTAQVEQQGARLAIAEPKAEAFDRWLSSNVNYSVGTVAKAIASAGLGSFGRNRLFEWMKVKHWIYRERSNWVPFQEQIERGRLYPQLGSQLNTRTGEQFSTVTVRITPKGAMKIADATGADRDLVADILEPEQENAA